MIKFDISHQGLTTLKDVEFPEEDVVYDIVPQGEEEEKTE